MRHAHAAAQYTRTSRLGNAEDNRTMPNVTRTRNADASQPIDNALNFIERIHLYAVSQVPSHATRVWLIFESANVTKTKMPLRHPFKQKP